MADIKSPEERSRNMAKIRSRDTKPEEYVRKLLFGQGYRYRKNVSNVPGHPDAWMAKHNAAVFVHGCFWHRHEGCKYAYTPKSHTDFWQNKFLKNIQRDIETPELDLSNLGKPLEKEGKEKSTVIDTNIAPSAEPELPGVDLSLDTDIRIPDNEKPDLGLNS